MVWGLRLLSVCRLWRQCTLPTVFHLHYVEAQGLVHFILNVWKKSCYFQRPWLTNNLMSDNWKMFHDTVTVVLKPLTTISTARRCSSLIVLFMSLLKSNRSSLFTGRDFRLSNVLSSYCLHIYCYCKSLVAVLLLLTLLRFTFMSLPCRTCD